MNRVGIEKIYLYPGSMCLSMKDLAIARGKDPDVIVNDYLIDIRALYPPYEDTITMGANALKPLLEDMDPNEIGMLIAGTEGGVDYGKPISTNIIGALGLHNNIRNYETKHACYSGIAAVDAAINWIASGLNKGKKAVVIAADLSRKHFNTIQEFVMVGVGAAVVISETPKILEFEPEKKGTWTTDIYDTFRPSARSEEGNNEASLYTYMDALEGSFNDYISKVGEIDFDTFFKKHVYHTPFPGMSFQAHRVLCNLTRPRKKAEVRESFEAKVMPVLKYARQIGSCYASSNFVGLCGAIMQCDDLNAGDRIGFYTYGSGAIGEFYSGIILPEARAELEKMKLDDVFASRKPITVKDYELNENAREKCIDNPNFTPDLSIHGNLFDEFYKGKGLLYLKKVEDWRRFYDWS